MRARINITNFRVLKVHSRLVLKLAMGVIRKTYLTVNILNSDGSIFKLVWKRFKTLNVQKLANTYKPFLDNRKNFLKSHTNWHIKNIQTARHIVALFKPFKSEPSSGPKAQFALILHEKQTKRDTKYLRIYLRQKALVEISEPIRKRIESVDEQSGSMLYLKVYKLK